MCLGRALSLCVEDTTAMKYQQEAVMYCPEQSKNLKVPHVRSANSSIELLSVAYDLLIANCTSMYSFLEYSLTVSANSATYCDFLRLHEFGRSYEESLPFSVQQILNLCTLY